MITEFRAQSWRCVRDARLVLTPLHALIGPNDSGKSTLLAGIARAARFEIPENPRAVFTLCTERLVLTVRQSGAEASLDGKSPAPFDDVRKEVGGVGLVRFSADHLRSASALIAGPVELDPRGANLAGVFDAVLNRDREGWDRIEESVRTLFPSVRRLRLYVVGAGMKELGVELTDGTEVGAGEMSEGLLYWLAFAALSHSVTPKLLLIEEPENGLHPSRIADVVRSLRAMTERGTQVVLATHSPLVVNELRPDEVSVVTRSAEHGTRVRRVADLPDLDRLLSVFSLGELWLSFADGKEEEKLFAAAPAK